MLPRVNKDTCQNYQICVETELMNVLAGHSNKRAVLTQKACEHCNAYIPKEEGEEDA